MSQPTDIETTSGAPSSSGLAGSPRLATSPSSSTSGAGSSPTSVIVLGSINVDLVVRGDRLPTPGETVLGGRFFQAAGGKGANQAVAAARLGLGSVVFIAAVGDDDFGRGMRSQLSGESRLDLRFVRTAAGEATGVALILVDASGQNCISVASGANAALTTDDVRSVPEADWRRAAVLLACLESPLDAVAAALDRARAAGQTTVLNPAPADVRIATREWLERIDVLTPNEHEAAQLSGVAVRDLESAEIAARRLQSLGARDVIVTLGSQGCLVAPLAGPTAHVRPERVTALDATAAGDQFSGALAVALSEGRSLLDAARWASKAAALSVTRLGAQPSLAYRAEMERS